MSQSVSEPAPAMLGTAVCWRGSPAAAGRAAEPRWPEACGSAARQQCHPTVALCDSPACAQRPPPTHLAGDAEEAVQGVVLLERLEASGQLGGGLGGGLGLLLSHHKLVQVSEQAVQGVQLQVGPREVGGGGRPESWASLTARGLEAAAAPPGQWAALGPAAPGGPRRPQRRPPAPRRGPPWPPPRRAPSCARRRAPRALPCGPHTCAGAGRRASSAPLVRRPLRGITAVLQPPAALRPLGPAPVCCAPGSGEGRAAGAHCCCRCTFT
jgi:hypothetical protein